MYVIDASVMRRARKSRGWSLRMLASLSGCSHNYIYMLETGQKDQITEDCAMRIARALEFDWRSAFGDRPAEKIPNFEDAPQRDDNLCLHRPDHDVERNAS